MSSPSESATRVEKLHDALARHLDWWGLRRFEADDAYFQWQRRTLSPGDLTTLHRLVELKRASTTDPSADVAFYDQAAAPHILPVLYSQRYDYYLSVGPRVAERIKGAGSVLDFGCGVGVLTTFYALQCPGTSFLGLDRSAASIAVARAQAERLGLRNARFEQLDVEQQAISGTYDLAVATHALLQAERDAGLPSQTWRTLERAQDPVLQADFERRTGLGIRLDRLCESLVSQGRAIVFEKTRQLARRIPFQRALAARGFTLLEDPVPLRYLIVEEVAEDGPLYMLGRATPRSVQGRLQVWNEAPEHGEGQDLYRCRGEAATNVWARVPVRMPAWEGHWDDPEVGTIRAEAGKCLILFEYLYVTVNNKGRGILVRPWQENTALDSGFRRALGSRRGEPAGLAGLLEETWPSSTQPEDPVHTPLYENHTLTAYGVWSALQDRTVLKEATFDDPPGQQRHLELGEARALTYLYWATTFDQRQIVVVERSRADLLEQYYDELLEGRTGEAG
jgi:SAM-dependent methyltransferase